MQRRIFPFLIIVTVLIITVGSYLIYKIIYKPNLHQTILQSLSGAKGQYGVVVKDLKTEEKESIYGDEVFETGSLYKLWIMATAYQQIQNGTLSEDEVLSENVSSLNMDFDIDPQSAELTEGTITFTVRDALKQMIEISHNYAALILTKRVGLSNVSEFLKENGFKNSQVGNIPESTANDIELFFEKLYKGQLANAKYTQEMLDLLKAQQLNEKLPKYLPKGTVIAHKTGEIDYLSHDAGIVYTKNRNYIIVVLSKSDYPPGAVERIAQISKSVYAYFTKQNALFEGLL